MEKTFKYPAIKKSGFVALFVLGTIVLVFLLYSQVMNAPFQFDDMTSIRDNQYIRITDLSFKSIYDAGFKSYASNRPVANISFALNYYFGGYDVFGYHLVNVFIHLLTGLFLFLLVKETLDIVRKNSQSLLVREKTDPVYLAFAVALVWLAHPLATQSVTYLVQRMTSMAAMFSIISLYCYVKARRIPGQWRRWVLYTLCVISWLLALGSKEISATLPFFIFLYEWYFFRDLDLAWLKRRIIFIFGLAVVGVAITLIFLGLDPIQRILAVYTHLEFTPGQRVMTEWRIVMMYLGLIFFPYPGWLNLDYDFPLSYSLLNPPSTLLSLFIILGFLGFAVLAARRDRIISFAILWFFGNLVIESTVLSLELVYEHRTYMPSMFVIFAAVLVAHYFLKKKWACIVVLCCVVGLFSIWTWQRNLVWTDDLTLWQDCLKKSPNKARTNTNYALALMDRGWVDKAVPYFERAIELAPNVPPLYRDLGDALLKKGKIDEAIEQYRIALQLKPENIDFILKLGSALEKEEDWDEAEKLYESILEDAPDNIEIVFALGRVLAQQGQYDEATSLFMSLLDKDPEQSEAYNSMGNVAMMQGRDLDAIDHYSRALTINPDYIDARSNLGRLFYQRGELERAIDQFRDIVRTDPENEEARTNLAAGLQLRKNINTAIVKVEKALKQDPQNPKLFYHLGELHRMKGSFTKAVENYEKALSIQPAFPQALRQIAVVYSLNGDHDKAISYLEQVVELTPDDPDAYYNLACMYSLAGRVHEAVSWLEKAIEKGFDDWELIKKDPDLNNVRKTEDFRKLINVKALGSGR